MLRLSGGTGRCGTTCCRTGLGILEAMKALARGSAASTSSISIPGSASTPGRRSWKSGKTRSRWSARRATWRFGWTTSPSPARSLITAATRRLIRDHFECAVLGHRKIKGVAQPVELFRGAVGRRGTQRHGGGRACGAHAAVGPRPWRSACSRTAGSRRRKAWARSCSSSASRVWASRDWCTRSSSSFGEQAARTGPAVATRQTSVGAQVAQGSPVIAWRCSPHYQNSSLHPVREFFERLLGFGTDEPPGARFDRLVRHLREYALARAGHRAVVRVSPVPAAGRSLPAARPAAGPRAGRNVPGAARVVDGLLRASAGPVHRGGSALDRRVDPRVSGAVPRREPVRPDPDFADVSPRVPGPMAGARPPDDPIVEPPFAAAGRRPDRHRTQGTPPDAVVEQIYDRTGGVPLFVEEFTKLVQESGVLDQAAGDSTHLRSLLAHEIPATLQDLIMARLDRMDGDREVAQLAATLGREFRLRSAGRSREHRRSYAPGRARQARAGGDPVCERTTAPVLLHFQACPARRRLVQRAGQGEAPAVPPSDRRGDGGTARAARRRTAGVDCPPLHRSGVFREGD